jgi:hypothetical protein
MTAKGKSHPEDGYFYGQFMRGQVLLGAVQFLHRWLVSGVLEILLAQLLVLMDANLLSCVVTPTF